MFYLVIALLVISSIQTEAVKVILRHPNNDAGNNTRIIGGRPIGIREAPWQVAIFNADDNELVCGGSVISKRHILTAAHCVKGSRASEYKIRAGSAHLKRGGQVRRILKTVYDGIYDDKTSNNDIAIMKLRKPLIINEYVTPVKIATDYQSKSGFASVTGWGVTRESSENPSPILRKVEVEFVPFKQCQAAYKKKNININANMVCAGAIDGGRDACQGDSGGPLVEDGTLFGIVSNGIGCGRPRFPGIYTSVARKHEWILKALAIIR